MFGLKSLRSLQKVEGEDKILVRYANFFGLFRKEPRVYKILALPPYLDTLEQINLVWGFQYGLLYRGWFKNSSIYRRVTPGEEIYDRPLAYIILSLDEEEIFFLKGNRQTDLLKDASIHPKFKEGALFVKLM